eukprot:5190169-Prymnesium_polylepis.1
MKRARSQQKRREAQAAAVCGGEPRGYACALALMQSWARGAQDAVEEEHAQLGRAEGEIDHGGRQEDRPILDQDAAQLVAHLIDGKGETLALNDREEAQDDHREDRPASTQRRA